MAAMATDDALTKASTEGAQDFVDAYYTALQNSRGTISTYYCPRTTLADSKIVPDILWNGNTIDDPSEMQVLFEKSMPPYINFDVQAIDAQILNPQYSKDENIKIKPEKNISFLVVTAGHLRLEDRASGPLMEFSETFLLVPNLEKAGGNGKGVMASRRSWLIQSQNFRYVVAHDPLLTEGQVAMDLA